MIVFDEIVNRYTIWWAVGSLGLIFPMIIGVAVVLLVVFKWLLVWRLAPGDYDLNGFVDFRRELFQNVFEGIASKLLSAWNYLPWLSWLYRLLGGKVASQVVFGIQGTRTDWDLVEVGSRSFVGPTVVLKTWSYEGSKLKLRRIKIGDACLIGTYSVIGNGASLATGCRISALTCVTGKNLKKGSYSGNPLVLVNSNVGQVPLPTFFPLWETLVTPFFHMLFWCCIGLFAAAGYAIFSAWRSVFPPVSSSVMVEVSLLWAAIMFTIMVYLTGYPVVGALLKTFLFKEEKLFHELI